MVRAFALALLLSLADAAYECSGAYKLTENAATTYCNGLYACDASKCCVDDATKCGHPSTVMRCTTGGKTFTPGATGTNKEECCVVDRAKCSSMSCDTSMGLVTKDGAADNLCEGATCDPTGTVTTRDLSTCCSLDTTKCGSRPTMCGSGKYMPESKYGASPRTVENCCEESVDAKCSTYGCTLVLSSEGVTAQFYEPDPAKADDTFSSADREEVKATKCCKVKAKYCYNQRQSVNCSTGKVLKATNEGSTAAECCVDDMTCSTYVPEPSSALGGVASSASGLEYAPVLFVTNTLVLSRLF